MFFVKGRSCLTNLLVFFEEATKYFDVSKAYDIVYLDFQKAFDKVPHDKLHEDGINDRSHFQVGFELATG